MGHSLLNLNIIMKKSLYNLYFIILFNSAPPLFRNPRGVTKATLCATCCCSCCRVLIPYLTTLAFGDPRGANYVRTTRDLSPLVLSSKENSVFFTSTNFPIHRGDRRQAGHRQRYLLLCHYLLQEKLRASALLLRLPLS